jgi:murein DD-endopeptidase MepM/ murein hydrolase activator NlpD
MAAQHTGTTETIPGGGPRLRRRRPAALLAALVTGGLAAALLGSQVLPSSADGDQTPVTSLLAADAQTQADETELTPQMAITEVEAQARLQEVAANRARRAAEAAAAAEAAKPDFVLPVHGYRVTTCFCMRWGVMHWGVDLAAPMLTPEYAAGDGVVLRAGAASGFGLAVYVLHENGDVTVYGHMEKILVKAGQVVEAGQQIALLGSRGQSTGPHLHFEVHQGGMNGKRIDPVAWLAARGVEV